MTVKVKVKQLQTNTDREKFQQKLVKIQIKGISKWYEFYSNNIVKFVIDFDKKLLIASQLDKDRKYRYHVVYPKKININEVPKGIPLILEMDAEHLVLYVQYSRINAVYSMDIEDLLLEIDFENKQIKINSETNMHLVPFIMSDFEISCESTVLA